MTQFSQVELLYNQFLNLSDEIINLIQSDLPDDAMEKLEEKDKLFKKIINARKTLKCSNEEFERLSEIENRIKVKEQESIKYFTKLRQDIEEELQKTKQKTKVVFAYKKNSENETGNICDFEE